MNRMYFYLIVLLYLIFGQFAQGQNSLQNKSEIASYAKDMLVQNFDSIVIKYQVEDLKEISISLPIVSEKTEIKAILSTKEAKCLNKFLKNSSSYSDQLSGLGDRDISFLYYKNDFVNLFVLISSITRDISIIGDKNVMHNRVSRGFEKYLVKLLRKRGIWNKNQKFTEF